MLKTLKRKCISFWNLSLFIKLWFLPVWMLLGISKVMILTLEFRRIAPYFGQPAGTTPWLPLITNKQISRALLIGRLIKISARYTPWESNCFPQAISARILLGLYQIPYILYFGLMREKATQEIKAHAWVLAGKVNVTGGKNFGQFTVVNCFITPKFKKVYK